MGTSVPEGGRIAIDSMDTGELTTALFRYLPTGAHLVEVAGTNTTRTIYDVTINSLETTLLSADFTPQEEE